MQNSKYYGLSSHISIFIINFQRISQVLRSTYEKIFIIFFDGWVVLKFQKKNKKTIRTGAVKYIFHKHAEMFSFQCTKVR